MFEIRKISSYFVVMRIDLAQMRLPHFAQIGQTCSAFIFFFTPDTPLKIKKKNKNICLEARNFTLFK